MPRVGGNLEFQLTVAPADTPAKVRSYRYQFVTLAVVTVLLTVAQQELNSRSERELTARLKQLRTGVDQVREQTKQPPNITVHPPQVTLQLSPSIEVRPAPAAPAKSDKYPILSVRSTAFSDDLETGWARLAFSIGNTGTLEASSVTELADSLGREADAHRDAVVHARAGDPMGL